jgi:hypothetical protein
MGWRGRIEAAGGKFQHGYHLLPRDMKPFRNFLDAGPRF